jgi:luciferase family oxidoreductase group 1
VLDLAPVSSGEDVGAALEHSAELVVLAERLGYHRHWVAEHHNMPGIASSAPAVLLAHLAAVTSTIRLGSGGVMLPNHAPLVVAEQFGMLEALHPGRIDLGIGRAPGTDPLTARALRRSELPLGADEFPQQLGELFGYFGGFPEGHPLRAVRAVPGLGNRPEIWLLGSSDYSAQVAGLLGMRFAFAHHFSAVNTEPALAAYFRRFRPSEELEEPYAMIGVSVVCAPTEEEARWLARPGELAFLRLRQGRPGRFPSPEEAAAHEFTPAEEHLLAGRTSGQLVGDPAQIVDGLERLVAATGVAEVMITTMVHGHQDRLRSYELVVDAMQPGSSTTVAGTGHHHQR